MLILLSLLLFQPYVCLRKLSPFLFTSPTPSFIDIFDFYFWMFHTQIKPKTKKCLRNSGIDGIKVLMLTYVTYHGSSTTCHASVITPPPPTPVFPWMGLLA